MNKKIYSIQNNFIIKNYKNELFKKKLMRIIIDETSVTLIDMKYKIKKEIKTNYKIIIAIFNIIKSII